MTRGRLGVGVLLVGLAALGASCFSPLRPACAFSCATDGVCPTAYTCGADGLCHRADGVGVCLLDPADGGATDAAADGAGPADGAGQ